MEIDNEDSYTSKKKSNLNSIIVMSALSLTLGLVAAFGIWEYLSKTQEKVEKLTVTKTIIVAGKELMAGVKITEADLTTKELTVQTLPKEYISNPKFIIGKFPKSTISTEEVITEEKLISEVQRTGLQTIIPKGYRAITIRVNDITSVGGYLNPGDRVDILSVVDSGRKSSHSLLSKSILQNVLIIAVGDMIYDPNILPENTTAPKQFNQVTLALSPVDSQKLALANVRGEVRLLLRSYNDKEELESPDVLNEDVYGYLVEQPPPYQSQIPSQSQVAKKPIDVILGGSRTVVFF